MTSLAADNPLCLFQSCFLAEAALKSLFMKHPNRPIRGEPQCHYAMNILRPGNVVRIVLAAACVRCEPFERPRWYATVSTWRQWC